MVTVLDKCGLLINRLVDRLMQHPLDGLYITLYVPNYLPNELQVMDSNNEANTAMSSSE